MSIFARGLVLLLLLALLAGCGADADNDDSAGDDDNDDADDNAAAAEMVFIPAGEFGMGCPSADDLRCFERFRVVGVEAFWIDVFETSAAQYQQCVAAGGCESVDHCLDTPGQNMPAQCMSFFRAEDYCAWRGKRLPTSQEWEKAARGADGGHDYPWGDAWEPTWANWCDGFECDGSVDGYAHAAPVDAFPQNQSPYGVRNMCGNVLEWTSTPSDTVEGALVVRGGSYYPANGMGAPDFALLSWLAVSDPPDGGPEHMGLRCAMSAD